MAVRVVPIADRDVPRVAKFLHAHLDMRVPVERWARAVDVPWSAPRPNAGVMLLDGCTVVGAHLAFYSERLVDGRRERFCNLGAWCVLPAYRLHALRLLRALVDQDGYHFTDLSPSGNVPAIEARLGFRRLDTTTALMPNLPWPAVPRRTRILDDPAVLERELRGRDLQLYRDHARAPAARHVLLRRGASSCYVMFRKDRRRGLPVFASILHVSDPEALRSMTRPLARHLLLRHGALATLGEERIVGLRLSPSVALRRPRPKTFRSSRLGPAQIDDLYSELVCLAW